MVRRLLIAGLVIVIAACSRDAPSSNADAALMDEESPAALRDVVAELMPRLERISGLDRRETLRLRTQDRAAARAYVQQRLDEEMPPADREGLRRVYVALGLIPDTLNLDALLLDLYTEQVIGYYDPTSRTMFVIEGSDAEALRPVLAHELVHALQDQHTNVDSLIAKERGNDSQTAAHAALEGHAMVVMFATLAEMASKQNVDPATLPSPAEELGPALTNPSSAYPVFTRAPLIVRETLLFPYLAGSSFVHALWTAIAPQERYPAPIDSLLPQSTEQVLHPLEKFVRTRDQPERVRFENIPEGWRVIYEDDLGQLETALLLQHYLGASARADADGWDGDHFVLLADAEGAVLHWTTLWDSPDEAERFMERIREIAILSQSQRWIGIEHVDLNGRPGITTVFAPLDRERPAQLPRPTPVR